MVSVTAAICTRNRIPLVRRALASLLAQSQPPAEILVVDNAPEDERLRALVARAFPTVRYVCEPSPGLDFSRNRALRETTSDIVAFLDDDAVADAGWSAALAAAFRSPQVGAVTGRVEALALETDAQRLFEANGGFGRGSRRVRLPHDAGQPLHGRRAPLIAWAVSVGSGCSLAVRRDLALRLGGFDEALDLGEVLPGGGDHDILWRVLESGYEVVYEPDALARHEHRREPAAMAAQVSGHQRALVALVVKTLTRARGRRLASIAAFLAWRLVKPGHRLAKRLVGRDPLPVSLLLRMWRDCVRGLWAYPLARREAERRRRPA